MDALFDPQTVYAFQQLVAGTQSLWRALSFLGDELFYLLLFPTLYWAVSPAWGMRLGAGLVLSVHLNTVLKLTFHTPRPFWVDSRIHPGAAGETFGLPSGHSQNAVVLWGRWGWGKGLWGRVGAAILALLIGLSRVALGVHFWGDVLLGWAVGALLLMLILWAEPRIVVWVRRVGPWPPVGAGLLLATGLILAAWMARALGHTATLPSWEAAWSLNGVFTAAGTWAGLLLGWAWLYPRGGFSAHGPTRVRILRLAVGLIGVVLLWAGLRVVLPAGEGGLPYAARLLRYGLVGFWITGLAPYLFRRWGWAPRP